MENTTSPLAEVIAELGLTVDAVFVPWSQSRFKKDNPKLGDRSLNWKVTLKQGDREIITTDYMVGIGHCPSYKASIRYESTDDAQAVIFETEHGKVARALPTMGVMSKGKKIEPKLTDVVYCLASDCDVLNYSTYEEYAQELGMDPDSRKGEAQYRETLANALRMRNGLGVAVLQRLQEAAQDY